MWGEDIEKVDGGGGKVVIEDGVGGGRLLEEREECCKVGGRRKLCVLIPEDIFDGIEDYSDLCKVLTVKPVILVCLSGMACSYLLLVLLLWGANLLQLFLEGRHDVCISGLVSTDEIARR